MSEMSVSMILKLVDQVSGPAKGVESELQKLKRATDVLNDIQKGPMKSSKWDEGLKVVQQRRQEIEALQKSEQRAATVAEVAARETAAAKTSAAASATAAAGQIVAANEKIAASEQRTLSAIERSTKEQAAAIQSLQRQRATAHAQAAKEEHEARQKTIGNLATSSVGGFVAGAAGTALSVHAVAHGIRSSMERGAEYQHEDVALSNAGRSVTELAEMHEAARRVVAAVPTASFTESLKALNETTSAFGSVEHAVENLPFVMRTASVLHGAAGDKISGDAGEMGNLLARFFEERGTAGDPHVFQHEANELVRSMVFTRGNFNPREALNFAQQAKSALQNYDLDFLTRVVPTISSTMGGERAGTAAKAFDDVIMGKVNDAKQAGAWEQYGLIDPSLAVKKNGKTMGWKAGAVQETNLFRTNPLRAMTEIVLPALKAHGVDINDRLELSKALATLYRNPNANFFANELAQPQQVSRLRKDAKLIDETKTPDEIYKNNLAADPTIAMKALTASIENLQTVATSPGMATAAKGITAVAEGLQSLAKWGGEHPNAAMGVGAGVGAAGLAGSGYLLYKLSTGFGLSTSATALTGAATALDAAAARLGAPGAAPGLPTALEATPVATAALATGAAPAAAIGAATTAAIAASAVTATMIIDKYHADEPGHRPWTLGRLWRNVSTGHDDMPTAGEIDQSVSNQASAHTALDEAKAKAESAKQTLDLLNGTVQPKVDLAGLERLVALIGQANAGLDRLGSRGRSGGMSFSPSPGALHDGPEAH